MRTHHNIIGSISHFQRAMSKQLVWANMASFGFTMETGSFNALISGAHVVVFVLSALAPII